MFTIGQNLEYRSNRLGLAYDAKPEKSLKKILPLPLPRHPGGVAAGERVSGEAGGLGVREVGCLCGFRAIN